MAAKDPLWDGIVCSYVSEDGSCDIVDALGQVKAYICHDRC